MVRMTMAFIDLSVEDMLGVKPGPRDTRLGLANAIERGLPVGAVDSVARAVAPDDVHLKSALVPKATLARRRNSPSKRLSVEEGNRLFRVAEVYSFAGHVFGSEDRARDFLSRPHTMLDNKTPLHVAMATAPGAEAVMNIMGRVAYGGAV
jgi:putative toxin-antitoxin system antitoxin component (TIGR02293 family)